MARLVLTTCALLAACAGTSTGAEPPGRLSLLANAEAWKRLPGAPEAAQPLPAWARALAGQRPLTTARMLELDTLHRTGDRLDARLRAVARWACADANRSPYGKAMAEGDLARAGGDAELLRRPAEKFPAVDRMVAAFARKMMLNAAGVTDGQVKELIETLGEERVMALVALVAHASFQDRVFLALNIQPEEGGVPAPVTTRFGRPAPKAPKSDPKTEPAPKAPTLAAGDDWLKLRRGLDDQRARPGRIRVPTREEVERRLGKGNPALWQSDIVWSRVAYGYQPELTAAWFDCSGAFRQESSLDSLFFNSVFWVVTDSLQCFY